MCARGHQLDAAQVTRCAPRRSGSQPPAPSSTARQTHHLRGLTQRSYTTRWDTTRSPFLCDTTSNIPLPRTPVGTVLGRQPPRIRRIGLGFRPVTKWKSTAPRRFRSLRSANLAANPTPIEIRATDAELRQPRSTPAASARPDDIVMPDMPILVAHFCSAWYHPSACSRRRELMQLNHPPNGNLRPPLKRRPQQQQILLC